MKAPWHLWVVGFATLLWNAGGAFDYLMTQTQNANYMSNFTPEQLAYFYSFPTWANIAWAIGVWFGVFGSILLLMRKALALWSFVLSFLGMIGTTIFSFFVSDASMVDLMGVGAMIFTLAIVVVGILLIWYARAMKTVGVLA